MDKNEILLLEYQLINEKIEQFIGIQFSILNIILLTIGGFLFFIYSGDNTEHFEHFKYLPFLIILTLFLLGYQYQRVLGLQGYKQYLEVQLNSSINEKVIFYGHLGMKFMGNRNLFSIGNVVMYSVIYLFSIYLACTMPPTKIFIGYYIGYAIVSIAYLIFSMMTIGYTNKVETISNFINSFEVQIENSNIERTPEDFTIDEIIKKYPPKKTVKKKSS